MPVLELPEQQFGLPDHSVLTFVEYGSGEVTLLVHGSLCDYRYWRWQMAAMGEYGRVVAPSLRGYWPNIGTTPTIKFLPNQQARDLIELIQAISPDQPVNVVGHSRGALVAMEMAILAPRLIRAMVLADPGMNIEGVKTNKTFLLDAAHAVERSQAESGLAAFIDAVSGADTWHRMTGWFKTMVTDNAGTLLMQAQEANHEHIAAHFSSIACPVLLLGGQQSPDRYARIMDVLQVALPHATRDTIPMASHGMNLANPKTFNRKVLAFFDSLN